MGNSLQDLVDLISEFPSVGPRQARRIVQFLLKKNGLFRTELAEKIAKLSEQVFQCPSCFRFAEGLARGLCSLCKDTSRDPHILMVVEKDVDIEGVEASSAYHGQYFVLGGLMPLARQRKNADTLRTKELLVRVQKNPSISDSTSTAGGITEIIFALATTPEGDFTASELAKEIRALNSALSVTLLGRGLSVGAEIEYADHETLRNALKNRA